MGDKLDHNKMNPTIRKCLQHLDVIKANDQTKQIVYMYMKIMDEEIKQFKRSYSSTIE